VNDIDKPLGRLMAAYQAAVLAKDAEAFMALYDPKVRVFDTWGVWSYDSHSAWRSAIESWFTSLGGERVKVSFDDVQTAGNSELATLHAVVTYAGLSASGEPLRAMQNRISWVLRTSGHVLRVVHEHTSVPVGFEDNKAILQRRN
jgi:ketosteroid isomerase-like protein